MTVPDKSLNIASLRTIRVPKTWPEPGESIDKYRSRIYGMHLERFRQQTNLGPKSQPVDFKDWMEVFGSEVDQNWELNKNKKQEKALTEKIKGSSANPWYFSDGFLFFLFMTVLLSPAIPVLSWLRGPRNAKHIWVIISKTVLTIAIFAAFAIYGNSIDKNKTQSISKSQEMIMPNAVGMNYGEFVDNNTKFIEKYFPDTIDLIESRSVWNNYNWVIVAQIPPAGSKFVKDERLCFGVVKTDELDLSRQRLSCWQELIGFADLSGFDYNLLSKDLISISINDPDLKGYFLKAKVWIEMKDWNSVMLTYCSYEPVGVNGNSSINLKLDAGASGTVFGDGGESFDAGLFNDWNGEYTYEVKKIEKSYGSGCFSF
jgi:hypothetical protein